MSGKRYRFGNLLFVSPIINYSLSFSVEHHICYLVVVYFLIWKPEWKLLVMLQWLPTRSVKVIITCVYLKRYSRYCGCIFTLREKHVCPMLLHHIQGLNCPPDCPISNIINVITTVIGHFDYSDQSFHSVYIYCCTTEGENHFVSIAKV